MKASAHEAFITQSFKVKHPSTRDPENSNSSTMGCRRSAGNLTGISPECHTLFYSISNCAYVYMYIDAVCVYIYTYVHICIGMYLYMYTHLQTHIHIDIDMGWAYLTYSCAAGTSQGSSKASVCCPRPAD